MLTGRKTGQDFGPDLHFLGEVHAPDVMAAVRRCRTSGNVPTARTTWPRVSRSGRAELQRRPQAPRPAAIAEEWADEYDEGTERLLLAIGGKAAKNAA